MALSTFSLRKQLAILLLISLANSSLLSAQVSCGFDEIVNFDIQNTPNFIDYQNGINSTINNYINTHSNSSGAVTESTSPIAYPSTFIIPVVVHILRSNATDPTISYAQVESQIDALNYAFSGSGGGVNTHIQFCLARTTVAGAPAWTGGVGEPGVMRYPPNPTYGDNILNVASSTQLFNYTQTSAFFPPLRMLNIWVVQTINSTLGGTVLGYSPLPLSNPGSYILDGVVIRADVFGSNINPPGGTYSLVPQSAYSPFLNSTGFSLNQGKTLVHEVGHYLNLYHPFQPNLANSSLTCVGCGTASDGDFCADTEPCLEPIPTYNCTTPIPNTCPSCPLPDPVNNYMYYATHPCQTAFTLGQSNRMSAYLINYRNTLFTVANQQFCGIIGLTSCIPAHVFSDFSSTGTNCVNQPLSFFPTVPFPNNTATTWNWVFPSGTPNSSTSSTPNIIWTSPGTYTVTCVASNGASTATSTQIISITACGINPNYLHNSQWHFGQYAALDFSTGLPVVNIGPRTHTPLPSIYSFETATTYSDNTGNTVFYTNGPNFWNSNNNQLNTTPIFNTSVTMLDPITGLTLPTSSQANGIISCPHPDPNLPNRYFIFCTPAYEDIATIHRVRYTLLNMNVAIPTFTSVTDINMGISTLNALEGINIVPHCNGRDYWLLSSFNDRIFVHLISQYGVSSNPVFTYTGSGAYSQIKVSPDNTHIAVPRYSDVSLINFNNSTGVLGPQQLLVHPLRTGAECVSFNSQSDRLYIDYYSPAGIEWYDISGGAFSSTPIPIIGANIGTWNTAMQLGPDNNIYIGSISTPQDKFSLSVIQNPNSTPTFHSNSVALNTTANPDISEMIYSRSLPNLMDGIKPSYTIPSFTYTYNSCNEISLTSSPCWGGYWYDIDWGDLSPHTQSSTIPTGVNHLYPGTGSYTITVTYCPPGQYLIPTITNPIQVVQVVNILPTNVPVTGPNPYCIGSIGVTSYSVPAVPGAIYTWNIGGIGTITSANGTVTSNTGITLIGTNSNTIDLTWNSAGTSIVTVTIVVPNCTKVGTISVIVVGNACSNSATILNPNLTSSPTSPNPNGCRINANTTISSSLSFTDLDIAVNGNFSITVNANRTLTITNCHLHTCQGMWQGIKLMQGARLVITGNTLIEDADKAVEILYPNNNNSLDINTAIFNKNIIAISIKNYSQASNAYPYSIKNTIFTSRDVMKPPCDASYPNPTWYTVAQLKATVTPSNNLMTPYTMLGRPFIALKNLQTRPNKHIELVNIGAIGGTAFNPTYSEIFIGGINTIDQNIFDNSDLGIDALNSDFTTVNAVFQNIDQLLVPPKSGIGVAVRATKNMGFAVTGTPDIHRVRCMAVSGNLALNNKFFDCFKGIEATDYYDHDLNNNDFRSTQSTALLVPDAFGDEVNNNRVGSKAIDVISYRYHSINMNSNYIANHRVGIQQISGKATYDPTLVPNSIRLSYRSISNNLIEDRPIGNTLTTTFIGDAIVTSLINGTGNSYGLGGQSTAFSNYINENTISNAWRGIQHWFFAFPFLTTNISKNNIILKQDVFTRWQTGIHTLINLQLNVNENTSQGIGSTLAQSRFTNFFFGLNTSQTINCNLSKNTYLGYTFLATNTGTKWTVNKMDKGHYWGMYLAQGGVIGQQGASNDATDNQWLGSFTNAHTNVDGFSDAQFSKLFVRGIGLPFKPTINTGGVGVSYGAIGNLLTATLPSSPKYCGISPAIITPDPATIIMMEKVIQDSIVYINNVAESRWMAKQQVYKLLRYDSSYLNVSTIIDNFYYNPIPTTIKTIQNIEDSIDAGNYVDAGDMAKLISPSNAVETKYKEYYRLFCNYVTTGMFDKLDSTYLIGIAKGCLYRDGPAVVNARIFYNALNREQYTVFDDECIENFKKGNTNSAISNKPIIGIFEAEVYPNPTNTGFNLKSNCVENCKVNIIITSLTGQKVIERVCDILEGNCFVNTPLMSGTYLVSITKQSTNETVIRKLIIAN